MRFPAESIRCMRPMVGWNRHPAALTRASRRVYVSSNEVVSEASPLDDSDVAPGVKSVSDNVVAGMDSDAVPEGITRRNMSGGVIGPGRLERRDSSAVWWTVGSFLASGSAMTRVLPRALRFRHSMTGSSGAIAVSGN